MSSPKNSTLLMPSGILAALRFVTLCPCSSLAQQRTVAVTFDDLPAVDAVGPVEPQSIDISILRSLDRHLVPATGFVVERTVQEVGPAQGKHLLELWVERGYDLGNHTFSHIISDDLTVEEFERGIVEGEVSFGPALAKAGNVPRNFRFPQNHTGDTQAKHEAIAGFLAQHGGRK